MSQCSRCQNDLTSLLKSDGLPYKHCDRCRCTDKKYRDKHKEQIKEYRELYKEHTKMRMQLRANSNPLQPPSFKSI